MKTNKKEIIKKANYAEQSSLPDQTKSRKPKNKQKDNSFSKPINVKGTMYFYKGVFGFYWGEKRPFAYGVLSRTADGAATVTVHVEMEK